MSEFNISPEFKALRNEKKKRIIRKRRMLSIAIMATLIISIITVPVIIFVLPALQANNTVVIPPPSTSADNSPTAPDATDQTASPLTNEPVSNRRSTTVFIDAGHGALNSTGALDVGTGEGSPYFNISGGKYEDQLNLEVALKLRDKFKEAGYTVIMLRENRLNENVTVMDRTKIANNSGAEVFISVHANSAESPNACGTRVLYYANRSDSSKCLELGNKVKQEIDEYGTDLSQKSVMVIDQDTYVIRFTKIPAILVETCFITNQKDSEMAISEEWQNNMASAIFKGVSELYPLRFYD